MAIKAITKNTGPRSDCKRWSIPMIILGFSALFYIIAWSNGLYGSKAVSTGVKIYDNGISAHSLTIVYPPPEQQVEVHLPQAARMTELGSGQYHLDPLRKMITYSGAGNHYLYSRQLTDSVALV